MELRMKKGYREWKLSKADTQEIDFGAKWTLGELRGIRVSWIRSTGEVYACQPEKDLYAVLGRLDEAEVVEVLGNYTELMSRRDGLLLAAVAVSQGRRISLCKEICSDDIICGRVSLGDLSLCGRYNPN